MKRIVFVLFTALVFITSSCELETVGNGKLDGMWHLVSVDTLLTDGRTDMSGERIYWSVQQRLLLAEDKSGQYANVLFRFKHSDGKLRLFDPYFYDRENGDKPITDVFMLTFFGINSLDETFTIESLDGSRMVLCSPELRLSFRKM